MSPWLCSLNLKSVIRTPRVVFHYLNQKPSTVIYIHLCPGLADPAEAYYLSYEAYKILVMTDRRPLPNAAGKQPRRSKSMLMHQSMAP